MELDIRGMLGDDGVMEVDRFIDSCLLSGISVITIIHGKGTGALRAAVQQYLRKIRTSSRSATALTARVKRA